METVGIYVHLPFCLSKCKYCDFNSYANIANLQPAYIKALVEEIRTTAINCKNVNIDTIFIGGGTPSCMPLGTISTILTAIRQNYNVLSNAEITIECNPNSVSFDKVSEWKESGVNRISIGLQTTNKKSLQVIGRTHTVDDYVAAIKLIHSFGINNINTDLMIGLPKQRSSDVKYAILLCNKLMCKHISCYSLILEENTPLYDMVHNGEVRLPKEEKTLGMYNTAYNTLSHLGYKRYEVSNFAISGYECKHNLNCWSMHQYLGFGAGAHSFYNNIRYNNIANVQDYIMASSNISVLRENVEPQSQIDLYNEAIMLGLRKADGVDMKLLSEYLGEDFAIKMKKVINKYIALGLVEISHNCIRATQKGVYVLNQIILDFAI